MIKILLNIKIYKQGCLPLFYERIKIFSKKKKKETNARHVSHHTAEARLDHFTHTEEFFLLEQWVT